MFGRPKDVGNIVFKFFFFKTLDYVNGAREIGEESFSVVFSGFLSVVSIQKIRVIKYIRFYNKNLNVRWIFFALISFAYQPHPLTTLNFSCSDKEIVYKKYRNIHPCM